MSFTIIGNETSAYGHARPKLKKTGKQHWTKEAKRYVSWKGHVVNCFLDSCRVTHPDKLKQFEQNVARFKKPIPEMKGKSYMHIKMYFKNEVHGDPENVFGSIADSLFFQDKRLAGSFDFEYEKGGQPRVEVTINI